MPFHSVCLNYQYEPNNQWHWGYSGDGLSCTLSTEMFLSAGCRKKIKNFCGRRDIIVIAILIAYQKYWLVPLTGTGQIFQKYIHYFSGGLLYHP